MAEADRPRDELVEDRRLKLQPEEFGVVREQRGIQIALDRGQVKRVVLKAGMVAHHQKCKDGEQGQQQQICGREIALAQPTAGRILRRF